jgi:hypothetical protein
MSVTLQQRIGLDRQRLRMYIENLPRLAPVIDEQLPLVETQANCKSYCFVSRKNETESEMGSMDSRNTMNNGKRSSTV